MSSGRFLKCVLIRCRVAQQRCLRILSPPFAGAMRAAESVGRLDTCTDGKFHTSHFVVFSLYFVLRVLHGVLKTSPTKYKAQSTKHQVQRRELKCYDCSALPDSHPRSNSVATKQAFQEELNPYAIAKQQ